ncbi:MAG: AmmeMemoRadiSam system protein B [Planctomycetes bacterium]|nr:AmmeMemoRadiSam system protein B [Planctomycetota bacterium]
MVRSPVVEGQFYPSDPDQLRSAIEKYTPDGGQREKVLGALSPHAGYVFSGPTAGKVFAKAEVTPTVVVLNPSHNAFRPPCALWSDGAWKTPLGTVELDENLNAALAELDVVSPDDGPHLPEHSGEVVVPFLQYHRPDVKIVVICITPSAGKTEIQELGNGIADCLKEQEKSDTLVVASSDMSHEQGRNALETVNEHDPIAIERMEQLAPEGLIEACDEKDITMCGVSPAAAMMISVEARGGSEGELVARATSADSPQGRGNYVVGYAGMIFR